MLSHNWLTKLRQIESQGRDKKSQENREPKELKFPKVRDTVLKLSAQFATPPHLPLYGRAAVISTIITEAETTHTSINAPVQIKNFFVLPISTAAQHSAGECYKDSQPSDQPEDSKKTIARILEQITQDIEHAKDYHIKENCELSSDSKEEAPKFKVKVEKTNHITRATTSEFRYFTHEVPISLDGAEILENGIRDFAGKLPPNFHLALSSFPIMDNKRNVYNLAFYVQCGSKPEIAKITKLALHRNDINYFATRNPHFFSGSIGGEFARHIDIMLCKLRLEFAYGKVSPATIDKFLQLCQCNTDYPPPQKLIELLESLKNAAHKSLDEKETKNLTDLTKDFKNSILNKGFLSEIKGSRKVKRATLDMLDQGISEWKGNFSRVTECTTDGGAKFAVALDICNDFSEGITKLAIKLTHKKNAKECQPFLFWRVSHILTANSIVELRSSSALSSLEKADANFLHTGLYLFKEGHAATQKNPKEVASLSEPKFGAKSKVYEIDTFELKELPADLLSYSILHQEMLEAEKASNQLQIAFPKRKQFYQKFLYIFLTQCCIEIIDKSKVKNAGLLQVILELQIDLQNDVPLEKIKFNALFESVNSSFKRPRLSFVTDFMKTRLAKELDKKENQSTPKLT